MFLYTFVKLSLPIWKWNTHISNTNFEKVQTYHIEDLYPYQKMFLTLAFTLIACLCYMVLQLVARMKILNCFDELELEMFIVACIVTNSWSYQYIKYAVIYNSSPWNKAYLPFAKCVQLAWIECTCKLYIPMLYIFTGFFLLGGLVHWRICILNCCLCEWMCFECSQVW